MSEIVSRKLNDAAGERRLKVDVVASFLMALLIIVGGLVAVMFVIFLTELNWESAPIGIKVEEERIAGRGDHAAGFDRDIDPPGSDEAEVLAEPSLEKSLEAVTDAASAVAASVDSVNSNSDTSVQGKNGRGDSRPPGPLGEGDDIVPRFERWDLKFQAKGLRPYAEQLDFYQIELACIGGNIGTVDYASGFSGTPKKRSGTVEDENKLQRLFFMWRAEGPLKQFDTQLLGQANIRTQGRLIVKFVPKTLEDRLAGIEKAYWESKGRKSVKEIAKTVFESRPTGNGFEFTVIDQHYRVPAK